MFEKLNHLAQAAAINICAATIPREAGPRSRGSSGTGRWRTCLASERTDRRGLLHLSLLAVRRKVANCESVLPGGDDLPQRRRWLQAHATAEQVQLRQVLTAG